MTQYTVTEALVKLKLADKKISDATLNVIVGSVGTKTASFFPAGFKNSEEFKNEVKKRLDSVNGLIEFRNKLKKAVVESNAKTEVVVGTNRLSVAEAIETKKSISSRKTLLERLVLGWKTLETQTNNQNAQLETKADQYVTALFSQNASGNDEEKTNARKNFIENNIMVITTHEFMRSTIEKLKDDIDNFEANVDVALSIVNATTKISVED